MQNLIDDESLDYLGAKLDADEALLLCRLASRLSRDDLTERGFTILEAERIEAWMDDCTR